MSIMSERFRRILAYICSTILLIVVIRKFYCNTLKDNCLVYNTPMVISTWEFTNAATKSNDFLNILLIIKYLLFTVLFKVSIIYRQLWL